MQLTRYDIVRLFGIIKVLEHSAPVLSGPVGEHCGAHDPLSEVAKSPRCGVAPTPSARVRRTVARGANAWNKLVLFCGGCRQRLAPGRGGAPQPAVPECLVVREECHMISLQNIARAS